jgi:hypothetical protein
MARGPYARATEELVTVHAGEAEVAQEDVGPERALVRKHGERGVRGRHVDHVGAAALECQDERRSGVGIVLGDEHAEPLERFLAVGGGRRVKSRCPRSRLHGGELDREGGAAAGALALRADRAAVHVDELARDREPEAEPALAPRRRAVGLAEPVEHARKKRGGDSLAGVRDLDAHARARATDAERHAAPGGSELHGVAEQVPEHLLDALRVGSHVRAVRDGGAEPDPFGLGGRPHDVERRGRDLREVHGLEIELQFSGDHPRDVEEVFDELRLRLGAAFDGVHRLRDLRGVEGAGAKEARPQQDGAQRGPQLVRDGREELVLHS